MNFSLILALAALLLPQNPWQVHNDAPAAFNLFLWLQEYAVYKFHMPLNHPSGCTLGCCGKTAEEIECSAYGNAYTLFQMRGEHIHKILLFGCAKCYPYNIGTILFNGFCNGRVIEIVYIAERQLLKGHIHNFGVLFCQILLQCIQSFLLCTEENHTVFAAAYNVYENIATAILLVVVPINPSHKHRYPAAVANGENAIVYNLSIFSVVAHHIQYVAIGYTYIARFFLFNLTGNAVVHLLFVEFVSYIEIFLHYSINIGQS